MGTKCCNIGDTVYLVTNNTILNIVCSDIETVTFGDYFYYFKVISGPFVSKHFGDCLFTNYDYAYDKLMELRGNNE